jgi:aminoacrylate hydrolase
MWESADAETHEAVIDGLFTRSVGAGEAVLLSAGLGGAGDYWRPQVAALAARHRVILYDQRGTGRSDRAALPIPYGVGHLAQDIRVVLDGLGIESAHIVGHAAGGVAGLELARVAPDRVRTLTIVNGWAVADPHFRRCMEIRQGIWRAGGVQAYLKAQPLFLYPADWISDHLRELDAQAVEHAQDFQSEAALFARMGALLDFDIKDALDRVHQPVLVLSALDDMLVPPHTSRALADGLANATLVEMAQGGHAVNVTEPQRFNEHLLSFLAANSQGNRR